tara:strand:+ start:393 stop:623 length:231 start_codon:yes stop_codon:yes gene_type:complete
VLKINDHRLTDIKLRIMNKLNMVNLGFSYNETTYNSKITLIEKIDLEKVNLKIDFLKSLQLVLLVQLPTNVMLKLI